MKIDLHCHTEYSGDSSTPIGAVPARCREQDIAVQAITDHGTIEGAQKIRTMVEIQEDGELPGLTIIVGEEITTRAGELVGLFLDESIPHYLSAEETVRRIKAQQGLVLLPHGFDPWKRYRLRPEVRERIADSIDIIETFNASVSRRRWNREAVAWAETHGALMSAGSDAHTLASIGRAWVEVSTRPIRGPEDLLAAMEGGVPMGRWSNPILGFLYKVWDFFRWRIKPWKADD
ncbi:MAG TPA: PHP domain-containing protein [Chloroflexi bacterium]|nr:PHP domain-containing protein [Chloroflexota bacterium]